MIVYQSVRKQTTLADEHNQDLRLCARILFLRDVSEESGFGTSRRCKVDCRCENFNPRMLSSRTIVWQRI